MKCELTGTAKNGKALLVTPDNGLEAHELNMWYWDNVIRLKNLVEIQQDYRKSINDNGRKKRRDT